MNFLIILKALKYYRKNHPRERVELDEAIASIESLMWGDDEKTA